jgi:Uncharacterised nucleotidyltransferase
VSRRTMLPPIMALLQAASAGRRDLRLSAFDEAQVCWAVERGLDPLLHYSTTFDAAAAIAPSWPLLRATHLTARALSGEQLDAMTEIIDACAGHTLPLTLLKGISICDQYYPQPYLRPMRDIDFLVDEVDRPVVESILFKLGYRQQSQKSPQFFERHHHSMPFYHPQRGVWIEVHRRLFSGHQNVATDQVLSLDHVKQQLRPSEFQGRTVYRLSKELQIVYISAHWCSGHTIVDGLIAMLDTLYLLRNPKEELRWELILHWLHGSTASRYLYLVLAYLQKYQTVDLPLEILKNLLSSQRYVETLNLRILQTIIDRYLGEGKDFGPHCNLEDFNYVWRTLLSPGSPINNLILVMRHFLRLRTRLYSLKRALALRR